MPTTYTRKGNLKKPNLLRPFDERMAGFDPAAGDVDLAEELGNGLYTINHSRQLRDTGPAQPLAGVFSPTLTIDRPYTAVLQSGSSIIALSSGNATTFSASSNGITQSNRQSPANSARAIIETRLAANGPTGILEVGQSESWFIPATGAPTNISGIGVSEAPLPGGLFQVGNKTYALFPASELSQQPYLKTLTGTEWGPGTPIPIPAGTYVIGNSLYNPASASVLTLLGDNGGNIYLAEIKPSPLAVKILFATNKPPAAPGLLYPAGSSKVAIIVGWGNTLETHVINLTTLASESYVASASLIPRIVLSGPPWISLIFNSPGSGVGYVNTPNPISQTTMAGATNVWNSFVGDLKHPYTASRPGAPNITSPLVVPTLSTAHGVYDFYPGASVDVSAEGFSVQIAGMASPQPNYRLSVRLRGFYQS